MKLAHLILSWEPLVDQGDKLEAICKSIFCLCCPLASMHMRDDLAAGKSVASSQAKQMPYTVYGKPSAPLQMCSYAMAHIKMHPCSRGWAVLPALFFPMHALQISLLEDTKYIGGLIFLWQNTN